MGYTEMITTEYVVSSEKLPEPFDGTRLAFLSDLHDCEVGEQNGILLQAVQESCPDRILIGGDWITEEKKGKRRLFLEHADALLEKLLSVAPVYYSLGNHELRWQQSDLPGRLRFRDWQDRQESRGVRFLDNRSAVIYRGGSHIRLTGLTLSPEFYRKTRWRDPSPGQMNAWIRPAACPCYQILLAHSPDYAGAYARWGADLTLAGHNHGGWMRIPGIGGLVDNKCRIFPKYDKGRFSLPRGEMIVSAGLGSHTLPIRLNNPPELVVITLHTGSRGGNRNGITGI